VKAGEGNFSGKETDELFEIEDVEIERAMMEMSMSMPSGADGDASGTIEDPYPLPSEDEVVSGSADSSGESSGDSSGNSSGDASGDGEGSVDDSGEGSGDARADSSADGSSGGSADESASDSDEPTQSEVPEGKEPEGAVGDTVPTGVESSASCQNMAIAAVATTVLAVPLLL
jgi:hypothetical protein